MYSREYEAMLREDLEQLQVERLQATINRVIRNVAFYRESFERHGIASESIRGLSDLERLPFTTKDDLRRAYPYDMFAVPLRDIVRIHSTSGTTGKPIVVGYTKNDLSIWASLTARVLTAAGITAADLVQIAFNYNVTTAALGFHYGAERLGASVVPASTEDIATQLTIMRDYKTSALVSTPGYALHISTALSDLRIHPEELHLRTAVLGAEPWSEGLRAQIEQGLRVSAFDNYGTTEIIGPGVSFECEARRGLHVNEDHFIVEVVNPSTGERVAPGEVGELVFTTITKQGFPLIRFRTGDLASLATEPCACGRTLARMSRVAGRSDDMLFVGGVNVMPSDIEQVLLETEGVDPHYLLVLDRQGGIDTLEIRLEVPARFADQLGRLQLLGRTIQQTLERRLAVAARVTFVEPNTIARSTGGKMKRVIDRRVD
jgi:phenylacetate-CoA ligase